MICSHCYTSISINAIQYQRGKGLAAQVQCPHCDAWIGKSPILAKLKMLGFYMTLAMVGVFFLMPEYKNIAIAVGIFTLIILMVSHFMDHVKTIEAPLQKEDEAEHRKKYR